MIFLISMFKVEGSKLKVSNLQPLTFNLQLLILQPAYLFASLDQLRTKA